MNQKKQKTNTLTQENVNGIRRFTTVCRFLLHHGSRFSPTHCNPNEVFFKRRYIGVTERSFHFVHFLSNQTEEYEPKIKNQNQKTKNQHPHLRKCKRKKKNLREFVDFFFTMVLVFLESTATQMKSYFSVDILV